MSLREAYTLAHTAQCRLQMEASRPDRKLRFVVGHLMHYESMRLRIVEIEHDISRSRRNSLQSTAHHQFQHRSSTRSISPPSAIYDDLEDEYEDDEEEDAGLSLQRFPSGSSRPPDMIPDDEEEEDEDDEPVSPDEPDAVTLEKCVKAEPNESYASLYEAVRKCRCNGKPDAPSFDRMWDLPPDQQGNREGVTRAVARVGDDEGESKAVREMQVEVKEVAA